MGLFSNFLSQFQPKKPAQQPAQSPNASYQPKATPNLFSSMTQNFSPAPTYKAPQSTPSYSQPKQNMSYAQPVAGPKPVAKPAVSSQPSQPAWMTSYYKNNPVSSFGNEAAKGNGISELQRLANPSFPYKIAPPASSSQPMASYPQNQVLQSRNNQPTPQPTVTPVVQPKSDVPTQSPATLNMLDWYKKSMGLQDNIAQNQAKSATTATDQYVQMIKDSYGRQRQDLIDQIPYLKGLSDQTKNELLAAADDIRKSGELEKAQTTATYDEAALTSARTKKTTDADRQKMFAALGTLDSTGSMGFTGQQINSDEEFNRVQQNRETEKARAITAIDGKVNTAARTAKNEIAKEAANFNEVVRKIMSQANATDMDKEAQVRAAYSDLKTTVQGINDTLAVTKQNGELEKLKYLAEAEKAMKTDPTVAAKTASDLRGEYFDRTKNSKYDEAINSYQKIMTAPDDAAGDMSMIFGYMKVLDPNSTVREGEYATAQQATGVPGAILNAYNQALAGRRLNPDQRSQFQGAALGAVKPIIEQQKTNESFYSKLAQQGGVDPNNVIGGQNILVKQKASGQVGILPVSEYDANLYERI